MGGCGRAHDADLFGAPRNADEVRQALFKVFLLLRKTHYKIQNFVVVP
jgi:hypothetical protein